MESQSRQLVDRHTGINRRLNLLIDGRKLGDGGIGVYIENLITGLLDTGSVTISVLADPSRAGDYTFKKEVSWIFDRASNYSLDELLFMPRRLSFGSFDLFHAPHYMLPYGLPIPSIVTVHDLIHLTHPERFYYPWIARPLITSAIRRAATVIAVSQDTRQALLSLTGVSPDRVVHIPNAIPDRLLQTAGKTAAPRRGADLSPYLLAIFSNVKPHKALPDLVAAYRGLRSAYAGRSSSLGKVPRLVLAGYGTEHLLNSDELLRLVGDVEGIHVLGSVSTEELGALHRKASALVVPSLTEGFCLPALEARSCGTPIICRPVPALLELISDRDLVAKDFSISAFTEALIEGIKSSSNQPRDVNGLVLEHYSKDRIASLTLEIYHKAITPMSSFKQGGTKRGVPMEAV